jgi:hypothetical protein
MAMRRTGMCVTREDLEIIFVSTLVRTGTEPAENRVFDQTQLASSGSAG